MQAEAAFRQRTSMLLVNGVTPKAFKACLRASDGSKQDMFSARATPLLQKPRARASAICVHACTSFEAGDADSACAIVALHEARAHLTSADEADRLVYCLLFAPHTC